MNDAKWYAVHTRVRAELLATGYLEQYGFTTLCPHYTTMIKTGNRRPEKVKRPLFPGYLFVVLGEGQSAYRVNTTPGVAGLVSAGGEPLELPSADMARLRTRCAEDGATDTPALSKTPPRIKCGDRVRVVHGSLRDYEGTVIIDNGAVCRIWLDKFRGVIPASMPTQALQPI